MQLDLVNALIKETYRNDCLLPNPNVRDSLLAAKRFILDADMSEMMGHLATTPYEKSKPKDRGKVLVSQRRSARLPFRQIFVQYDGLAFRRGLLAAVGDKKDLWGKELIPADKADIIDPVGWLLEASLDEDNSNQVIVVSEMFLDEGRGCALPFAWCYTTSDETIFRDKLVEATFPRQEYRPEPAQMFDVDAAQLAHGVTGFKDEGCAIIYLNWHGKAGLKASETVDVQDETTGKTLFKTHYLVAECGGALRYIFAFLNMLNEVPVSYERARRVEGYLSNGKRRAAVQSDVIRLKLPNRTITYRDYAKQLVKGVLKRAAHPVRGHWRVYGAHSCGEYDQHDWGPTDATGHADCARCTASRTWIKDYHTKGDGDQAKVYSVGAR